MPSGTPALDEAVARLVASRVEQGLPAKIESEDYYRRLAALMQPPPAREQGAAR